MADTFFDITPELLHLADVCKSNASGGRKHQKNFTNQLRGFIVVNKEIAEGNIVMQDRKGDEKSILLLSPYIFI